MKHVKAGEFFITPLTSNCWQLWSGAWRFLLPTPFFSSEALSTVQSAERSIFRVILDWRLYVRKKIWDSSHHHLIPVWRLHRNERHLHGPPQASVGGMGCAYCDHLNFETIWRVTVYQFLTFQQEFDIETEVKCFAIGKRQSRVISSQRNSSEKNA